MIANISRLQWAAGLCIFVMLIFLAIDTDARGRGSRGGGGYSRSSAASHGSMRGRTPSSSRSIGTRPDRSSTRRDRSKRHDWHDDRRRRATRAAVVGRRLTIASWNALSCTRTRVIVNGVLHYTCGHAWYRTAYYDGRVTYVVVNTPPGY